MVPKGPCASPLWKYEDEGLDHFLQKLPVLFDLREKYLHGIDLLLPGILQSINPTIIARTGMIMDKCLEIKKNKWLCFFSLQIRYLSFYGLFC